MFASMKPMSEHQKKQVEAKFKEYEEKKREVLKDRPGCLMTPDGKKPEVIPGFTIHAEIRVTEDGRVSFVPVLPKAPHTPQEASGDTNDTTDG